MVVYLLSSGTRFVAEFDPDKLASTGSADGVQSATENNTSAGSASSGTGGSCVYGIVHSKGGSGVHFNDGDTGGHYTHQALVGEYARLARSGGRVAPTFIQARPDVGSCASSDSGSGSGSESGRGIVGDTHHSEESSANLDGATYSQVAIKVGTNTSHHTGSSHSYSTSNSGEIRLNYLVAFFVEFALAVDFVNVDTSGIATSNRVSTASLHKAAAFDTISKSSSVRNGYSLYVLMVERHVTGISCHS